MTLLSYGQQQGPDNVELRAFVTAGYPKNLETCGGEWFIEATATSIEELSRTEIMRINDKVREHGCDVVYIDFDGVSPKREGQLYILGLKLKK